MEKKDIEAVKRVIFLGDPHIEGHPDPEIIFQRWGQYYCNESRNHCFVACDDSDNAIGVILCAPDTRFYQKDFNRNYFNTVRTAYKEIKTKHPESIKKHDLSYYKYPEGWPVNLVHFYRINKIFRDYPAHLHINIHPDYRRHGLGKRLVNRLCEHLKENAVSGLHLAVGAENSKAIAFYEKYGFKELLNVFPKGRVCIYYGLLF